MKVFIGCSASEEIDNKYVEKAKAVCEELVKYNYDLIFGTYFNSMMGECYTVFKNHQKKIIGVCLENYRKSLSNLNEIEIIYVKNVFERIEHIYEKADLFLILPGGIGTISELFIILEEFKNSGNNKKLILYNYDKYYEKMIEFLKLKINEQFITKNIFEKFVIVDNIESLKGELE